MSTLREARIASNQSINRFSKVIGYSLSLTAYVERGERKPTLNFVVDYAQALGYEVVLQKRNTTKE